MISCDKHDYIEIACTYRMQLELTFKDNRLLTGVASDTKLNADREECLELMLTSGEPVLVVLDLLKRIRALSDNPYFDVILLSNQ